MKNQNTSVNNPLFTGLSDSISNPFADTTPAPAGSESNTSASSAEIAAANGVPPSVLDTVQPPAQWGDLMSGAGESAMGSQGRRGKRGRRNTVATDSFYFNLRGSYLLHMEGDVGTLRFYRDNELHVPFIEAIEAHESQEERDEMATIFVSNLVLSFTFKTFKKQHTATINFNIEGENGTLESLGYFDMDHKNSVFHQLIAALSSPDEELAKKHLDAFQDTLRATFYNGESRKEKVKPTEKLVSSMFTKRDRSTQ